MQSFTGVRGFYTAVCRLRSIGAEAACMQTYTHALVQKWVTALDKTVRERFTSGALVADVGCGHGIATVKLAQVCSNTLVTVDCVCSGVPQEQVHWLRLRPNQHPRGSQARAGQRRHSQHAV